MKKMTKKQQTVLKWGLGLGGAAALAYIFWPKSASAAVLPPSPAPQPMPQPMPQPQPVPVPVPEPIIPGPGNIQITKGSRVPLRASLQARFGGDYVTVPGGTVIEVDRVDDDGTLWFQYNGQLLSSPVEDYSAVV